MSRDTLRLGFPRGAYAERDEPKLGSLDRAGQRAAGAFIRRHRARKGRARRVVAGARKLAAALEDVDDRGLLDEAVQLRVALRREGLRAPLVARSFALVREAARRSIGQRHFDTQLIGGWVLLDGMIAEMETGEGKTLTATLAASTAALAGVPVHVISVNDYLVGRDAENMGPVYRALGLSVGAVQHGMDPPARRAAYACDVTYTSNKELAFDYLRDRIALGRARSRARLQVEELADGPSRSDNLVLRGLCFGIVDEADSVLVDEARTPLIISGGNEVDELEERIYQTALGLAGQLVPDRDFKLDARDRSVAILDEGQARLEELGEQAGGIWLGPRRREELVGQALTAQHLFQRDQHYLVDDGKVHIIDEYTGRVMEGRSWERGLHQMIEAKEGLELTGQVDPLAKISYQRFFRRYMRLGGMTGTAAEVRSELWSVYRLPVVRVPTNRPLKRRNRGSRVYATLDEKWDAVVARIRSLHESGQPVLVGTRSVEASEQLSQRLEAEGLSHQVLNARQDGEEAAVIARAGEVGRITVATNMAGRGTDIVPTPEALEKGGLHVIATELHEARRIDRQLQGRAGRQGDPGSFEAILSIEDELVRAHGGGALGQAIALGPRGGLRAVRAAQRRAERLHHRMRRMVLQMDDHIASLLAFSGRGE